MSFRQALRLPPLPTIREILRMYDLRARKQLSQNFLLDPRVLRRVVRHLGPLGPHDTVLEVGPGPGGLTRELLQLRPGRLVVVELDRRFLPSLEILKSAATAVDIPMDVYQADILQFNTGQLVEERPPDADWRLHIIGNLPFNVSLPLLVRWMNDVAERRGAWSGNRLSPMTLSFQKEVANRLTAPIWSHFRSRLSVLAQAYCSVRIVERLRGSHFVPPPEVDVSFVRMEPLAQPHLRVPFPIAERLIRHAFHNRQKQLVKCLETLYPPERTDLVRQLFREAGIFPTRRAVELGMDEVAALTDIYHTQCLHEPELLDFNYRGRKEAEEWRNRHKTRREVLGGQTLTASLVHDDVVRQRMGYDPV